MNTKTDGILEFLAVPKSEGLFNTEIARRFDCDEGTVRRAKAKGAAGLGRKKRMAKPVAVTIKGDPAWRDWVDRAAKHCRLSVSSMVDHAVACYSRQQGFDEKPPERIP